MRWMWFVAAAVCFAIGFRTHSMGLAAFTLLAALGFLLVGTLALASSRIEGRSRDDSAMLGPEEMRRMRDQIEQRKREAAAGAPVSNDADNDSIPGDEREPRA